MEHWKGKLFFQIICWLLKNKMSNFLTGFDTQFYNKVHLPSLWCPSSGQRVPLCLVLVYVKCMLKSEINRSEKYQMVYSVSAFPSLQWVILSMNIFYLTMHSSNLGRTLALWGLNACAMENISSIKIRIALSLASKSECICVAILSQFETGCGFTFWES